MTRNKMSSSSSSSSNTHLCAPVDMSAPMGGGEMEKMELIEVLSRKRTDERYVVNFEDGVMHVVSITGTVEHNDNSGLRFVENATVHIDCILWLRDFDLEGVFSFYGWVVIRTDALATPHAGAPDLVGMGGYLVLFDNFDNFIHVHTGLPANIMNIQINNPIFSLKYYATTFPTGNRFRKFVVNRIFNNCILKYQEDRHVYTVYTAPHAYSAIHLRNVIMFEPTFLDTTMVASSSVMATTQFYTYKLSGLVWSRMASELCFGGAEPPSSLIVNVIPIPNTIAGDLDFEGGTHYVTVENYNFNAVLIDNHNSEIHLRKVVIGDAVDDDGLPIATISHVALVHRIETLAHHNDVYNAIDVMIRGKPEYTDRRRWEQVYVTLRDIIQNVDDPAEKAHNISLVRASMPLMKAQHKHSFHIDLPPHIIQHGILGFLGNPRDPTTQEYIQNEMDDVRRTQRAFERMDAKRQQRQ